MEIKDFIQNFADQFEEIDINKISPETSFRNRPGGSSDGVPPPI